jgi:hypothetical protein
MVVLRRVGEVVRTATQGSSIPYLVVSIGGVVQDSQDGQQNPTRRNLDGMRPSHQEKVPSTLPHHIPPVDVLSLPS